jgi:uncharacterized oxidoreductase
MGPAADPEEVLATGVRDMLRISDARMSGTSYGACVLHVAPESYAGGPLEFVRDGDLIELDVPARKLELKVSPDELARRVPRGSGRNRSSSAGSARSTSSTSHRQTRVRLRFPRRHRADARPRNTLMPTVAAAKLEKLVAVIMRGGGCAHQEAATIARRLVDSNLVGHESHGVLRVPRYLDWIKDGTLKPNMAPTVVFDSDTIAIIDGNRGFGQVIGEFAAKLGIAKARKTGIAMIGLRNVGHLGRVGDWSDLAADVGQVSLHFLNTSGAQRVAPFGGTDRRLSTNPISIGVPIEGADPVVLDVTTSMVAEGKLMVAVNKGERVPDGWIIDRDGKPTNDPGDFYDGGALLTVGGHKGSGLSIVTDLLAGAVSTGKSSDADDPILRNNMLSIYIAPAVYDADGGVGSEARRFIDFVKASKPAKAGEPVLAPGDVERRNRKARLESGVTIDDRSWTDLLEAAASVGVDAQQIKSIVDA